MVKLKKWKKTVATLFCAAACAWFPFSGYCPIWQVQAEEIKPSELYAQSAVLMDAETGRIDFRPQQEEQRKSAADGLIKPEECVCRSSTLD